MLFINHLKILNSIYSKLVYNYTRNAAPYSSFSPQLSSKKRKLTDVDDNKKYVEFLARFQEDHINTKDIWTKYRNPRGIMEKLIASGHLPRVTLPLYEHYGPQHGPIFCCRFQEQNSKIEFSGYAKSKKEAHVIAILKFIQTTNKDYLPLPDRSASFLNINEKKAKGQRQLQFLTHPPINILPNTSISESVPALLEEYTNELKPVMKAEMESLSMLNNDSSDGAIHTCLMTKRPVHAIQKRTHKALYERLRNRPPAPVQLPIEHFQEEILTLIENNDISLINAETGCGKSVKVPQIIFNSWCENMNGGNCNIIVCQPRRVAAEVISKRISEERSEPIGRCIGYCMKMNSRFLEKTGGIMFYTCGTLKEVLKDNNHFDNITHVIIDEVHERSADIDILLLMLRDLMMKKQSSFKLIFMSATANVDHLQSVFGLTSSATCNITIPHKYSVKRYYLEDTLEQLDLKLTPSQMDIISSPDTKKIPLYIEVVRAIHKKKGPGAILMFLPGWEGIKMMMETLRTNPDLCVIPMHSRLSPDEIEVAFLPVPPGKRKVILSTNIAQTSITIKDIVYVVDNGEQNQGRLMEQVGVREFGTYAISQSCGTQRAGRAGRVSDGEAFHLYTVEALDRMAKFPMVDVETNSLEDILFKTLFVKANPSAWTLFSDLITEERLKASLQVLEDMNLAELDKDNNYQLTALGRFAGSLGAQYNMAKALSLAYFFGIPEPIVNFIGMDMIPDRRMLMTLVPRAEKKGVCDIEELTKVANCLQKWSGNSDPEGKDLTPMIMKFARETSTIDRRLNMATLNFQQWKNSQPSSYERSSPIRFGSSDSSSNPSREVSVNGEIAAGCLLTATPNLMRVHKMKGKLRPVLGDYQHIVFSRKSVLNMVQLLEHSLIMSSSETFLKSEKVVLCDIASIISPLVVALFFGNKTSLNQNSEIMSINNTKLRFSSDKATLEGIQYLRFMLKDLLTYILQMNEYRNDTKSVNNETLGKVFIHLNKVTTVIKKAIKTHEI